ncbi:hypothetical protein JHK84_032626 [Glycine max]|nr:hypothetical protein JHK85_048220 [Glycine max]KAG5006826.1 hypothetical protein JHK85_025368 [Glycine max]KAG5070562.1 hypothetical protein JHK84_057419 [Glycine max]KAG5138858.1 hypothetical protein JHK84_032626 [Glycine max]
MKSNDFSKSSRTDYYRRILGEAVSGDSPAESRMRGDLHVRFGGRGYPDPTIIMPLQCYLAPPSISFSSFFLNDSSSKQLLDRARDAHSLSRAGCLLFNISTTSLPPLFRDLLVLFPDFPLNFRRLLHHVVPSFRDVR